MSEQIVNLNGVDIAYAQFGEQADPAILLVRGLGTQLIDWHPGFIRGLVDGGFRVVAFDNRDAGLSEKFLGVPHLSKIASGEEQPPYTLHDMADDIVTLMDHLNIETAHLFGISMGGMIGQVAVATHPDRFASFFSVMSSSSRPGLPGPTPEAQATLMAETAPDATQEEIVAATVKGLQVCGSPAYPESEETLRNIATRRYQRCHCPEGTARQMAAVVACGDRSALLRAIRVPTLVLHGEDDPLIPLAAGEDTASLIPGAKFETVPGMGHNLPEALTPAIVSIVVGFALG